MEDYNSTKDLIVKSGYRIAFYKSMLNKIKSSIRDVSKKLEIEDAKPTLQSYMHFSREWCTESIANYSDLYKFCKNRLQIQINIINKWIQE